MLKKHVFLLLYFFCLFNSFSQQLSKSADTSKNKPLPKPEIFTSGFIDVVNNGQVNASARIIKLFIGEPGKIQIPLSFYGGVSSNNFQNQSSYGGQGGGQLLKSNDHLVNQYINPFSGLVNVSIEGIAFRKKDADKITKFGYIYQLGERVLNGIRIGDIRDPRTGKPTNFLNTFATAGVYFQTGAWEKTNSKNVGTFWLIARYHICRTNPNQIKQFLPDIETNGVYHGYSAGFGVQINNLVDIKAIYYKYSKAPEIDYGLPIYQFTFNYTMAK
jgi:hypothetical protein